MFNICFRALIVFVIFIPVSHYSNASLKCLTAISEPQQTTQGYSYRAVAATKRRYRSVFQNLYQSIGVPVDFSVQSIDSEWINWANIASQHMNPNTFIFDKKISAEVAEFLNKNGATEGSLLNAHRAGDDFPENHFFYYWLARLPHPAVSFLSKPSVGLLSDHDFKKVRHVINGHMANAPGQVKILNALVEGLKRTFIAMKMRNEPFLINVILPLLFEQMQKSILDNFGLSFDRNITHRDFDNIIAPYDNFDEEAGHSSPGYAADRTEDYYEARDLLLSMIERVKSGDDPHVFDLGINDDPSSQSIPKPKKNKTYNYSGFPFGLFL